MPTHIKLMAMLDFSGVPSLKYNAVQLNGQQAKSVLLVQEKN